MAVNHIYHVTPSVNGWKAEIENSDEILCEGTNKDDVVNCITEKAQSEESSNIIIHNREGEYLEEYVVANKIAYIKNKK